MQPGFWPEGKSFAFSIFDDTDRATLANVPQIYSLLVDLGFRTTKSVWPLAGDDNSVSRGLSCGDGHYLAWVKQLQQQGFEIGYHMASCDSSSRLKTVEALERFADYFGHYPKSMANHVGCLENIYWGASRVSGINRLFYNLLTRGRRNGKYQGHVEGSRYFWADLCKQRIKYVRNLVFPQINTLQVCPLMPYHDSARPYVNYWYASSEGSSVKSFTKCLNEKNQDLLEEEGGACIVYTHFAFGFNENGRIHGGFRSLMERLSRKNGWFVPVSTLLDYLLEKRGLRIISARERNRLERNWLLQKSFNGTS